MSKIIKIPVEELQRFKRMLMDAADCNKIRCINELNHRTQLLIEEVDRQIFEIAHPEKKAKEEHSALKQWLKIFCNRYEQHIGRPYTKPVEAKECKAIENLLKLFEQETISYNEYLEWVFETFLTDDKNETFNPPAILTLCSSYIIDKYTYEHKDRIKTNKEDEKEEVERIDLYNRARALYRQTKDEKFRKVVQNYKDGGIEIVELRNTILRAEAELGEKNGNQTTV